MAPAQAKHLKKSTKTPTIFQPGQVSTFVGAFALEAQQHEKSERRKTAGFLVVFCCPMLGKRMLNCVVGFFLVFFSVINGFLRVYARGFLWVFSGEIFQIGCLRWFSNEK